MLWMLIRNSSTGSRIIPYYCRKPASKAPRSNWNKVWFEWMDFTSLYRGRTSLRLGYFHTLLWFPTTGTIVSRCECVFVYYMVYENTINSTIKQKDAEIIIKDMAFIYSVLKPLMSKFRNITRLILGFDFGSPVESPSCKHVFVRVGTVLTFDRVTTNHVVEVWLDT